MKSRWIKAISGISRPLLNIARMKKLYVFDGRLYVLYRVPNDEVVVGKNINNFFSLLRIFKCFRFFLTYGTNTSTQRSNHK